MYSILVCAAAGVAVFLVLLAFKLAWWIALLIGVVIFTASFVVLSRIIIKKVMVALELAGKDLQGQRFEKAIRVMKDALRYGPWQLYVSQQINSQIGMAYYIKRDFSNAFPHLEQAFFKNWIAMGMLAICYLKRQKRDKMEKAFEKAVQWNGKESLLWNLYAYCLAEECNDTAKAIEVLNRGLKKLPGDPHITENLDHLTNNRKMKMRSFGDPWYQFHLESLGQLQKHQMAAMGGRMQKRMTVRR
jgi:Putative Zn-dependent protease, contains TPR repeats